MPLAYRMVGLRGGPARNLGQAGVFISLSLFLLVWIPGACQYFHSP